MSSNIPGDASFGFLSGASGGSPAIAITATSSGGAQTLHTAVSGTNDVEHVTLWAANVDGTTAYQLTLELGAVTLGPFQLQPLAAPTKILEGWPMNNGLVVKGYADAASKIVVGGKAIQIVEGAA